MHYTLLVLLLTLTPLLHFSRSQSSIPPNDLTNVTCRPGFDWASNSAQQSPCIVAAATAYACSSIKIVPTLRSGYHYNTPGDEGQPVNMCTCSWVAYNLFSACTACQGDDDSILPFPLYSQNCSSSSGDGSPSPNATAYYPSGIVPLDDASIPYYATVNPDQWQGSVFNITQAKNISSQGFHDVTVSTSTAVTPTPSSSTRSSLTLSSLTPTSLTPSSGSSNKAKPQNEVATIAGSLAGGFVLLLLVAAVIVFRVLQKRRNHDASYSELISPATRFTMDLPTTSMDIIPYTLPPSLPLARTRPSKRNLDASNYNSYIDCEAISDTQLGSPQSQIPKQGVLLQVSPPAYSELFDSARNDVQRLHHWN